MDDVHITGTDDGTQPCIDWVGAMATVACELHHAFAYFHWTGTARDVCNCYLAHQQVFTEPLPPTHWQSVHTKAGTAASSSHFPRASVAPPHALQPRSVLRMCTHFPVTLPVPPGTPLNAYYFNFHNDACSTLSEIVVPILDRQGNVVAVLDVDSDHMAAFSSTIDQPQLEALCTWLGNRFH